MARQFVIDMPLPPVECSPNRCKRNHAAKAKAFAESKSDARIAAVKAMQDAAKQLGSPCMPLKKASVKFVFYCGRFAAQRDRRYRPKDHDNAIASCKGVLDGLVASTLLPSDTARCVSIETPEIKRRKAENYDKSFLRVVVTEVV